MVTVILYVLSVLASTMQSALGKSLGAGDDKNTFNLAKMLAAAVIFTFAAAVNFTFHFPTLCYGTAYGAFLFVSMLCGLAALTSGPMAITSMLVSFSLIIPTLYGIIVLKEKVTVLGALGLVLICISFALINLKPDSETRISSKWLAFTVATMMSNGMCSVIQKMHQSAYVGLYRSEFMMFASLSSLALFLCVFVVSRIGKSNLPQRPIVYIKGFMAGITNGGANFLSLYLAATQPAAVLFPILSVCTSIASLTAGRVIFKEKLRKLQLVGFAVGIVSLVLVKL